MNKNAPKCNGYCNSSNSGIAKTVKTNRNTYAYSAKADSLRAIKKQASGATIPISMASNSKKH